MFGCVHNWAWPQWDEKVGKDMQTCVECGARRVSLVQIHKPVRRPCLGCGMAIEPGTPAVLEGTRHPKCA